MDRMRIQCWCNGQLVGELAAQLPWGTDVLTVFKSDGIRVARSTELTEADEPHILKLKLGRRNLKIDQFALESATDARGMLRHIKDKARVPGEARRHDDVATHELIYTWEAFDLDVDTYEQVFDLPTFEPV